jgi:GNAT superfamily N-acetyltransferase
MQQMLIRPIEPADRSALWRVMEQTVRSGETCAVPMESTPDEAVHWWTTGKEAVFVAEEDGQLLGTYYIRTNQLGNGSHVANAGYLVADAARGKGVAKALCAHSLEEARRRGYLAMQFNFVVETNETAVRLWQKMGFQIQTTIPKAFRHPSKGLVGAHVMWQWLGEN